MTPGARPGPVRREELDRGVEARTIVEDVAAMDLIEWLNSRSVSIPEAIWALAVVIKRMKDQTASPK